MSNRVNSKLYKVQDLIVENIGDSESFINQMVNEYYKKSGNQFININLKGNIVDNQYQSKLLVFKTEKTAPKWINFLNDIVENQDELIDLETKYSSFILFIFNKTRIYAITKGYYGRFLLEEYMDKFFGLEVLSRLIDKSVTEIRKIEERGVFGVELGAERYFRQDYSLSYDDDFGKIYRSMLASIKEKNFAKLGIIKKRDDISKVSVAGSSSFEVSTNFDYDELVKRIIKIEELLETVGVQFNQFYRLSKNELAVIKDNLNFELIKMAYNAYLEQEPIDFYHPDIFGYMKAIEVRFNVIGHFIEIPLGNSINFIDVINKLVDEDIIDTTNENTFIETFSECFGAFLINEDGIYSNDIKLDKWIGGEIEFDGKKFFKIDNDWYRFRESFNEYLNKYFSEFEFDTISPDYSLKEWNLSDFTTENLYNLSYKNEENFIVTDIAFLYNLEICDLIRIDKGKIYLYHLKKGLGRDMRVLGNQIINGARIIKNAINEEDNKSLNLYYESISKKNYESNALSYNHKGNIINLSKRDFISLFKTNKICFVFTYSSNSVLNIKDEIISTNSRVAKLSLLYCMRDMRNTDFEFLIERISHH